MAYRGSGSRVNEYDERESHYSAPPARVAVRERERDYEESRVPAFMREDGRRNDAGPLVLRQRDVETVERARRRSPPPMRVRETRVMERARSVSPPPRREFVERDEVRVRAVERERVRSPSRGPSVERIRTRIVEREMSPSPPRAPVERMRARFVERERSVSPIDREREHIRIVHRERERSPSPSPSPPPPPPQVIRGPRIEREVVTHYRDIDHGVVAVRPPSPPPAPRGHTRERDSEIDIYTSRNATEVDIHKHTHHSHSRGRSHDRSHSRERVSYQHHPPPPRVHDDEVIVHSDRHHLHVDIDERRGGGHGHHHQHRRAHSAAPPVDRWDEGEYITSKIDARGRPGEAFHGATKDWEIVDVPPGTERVRMDGAGGGGAEVTWQKYSGVRRSRFIPERDDEGRGSIVSEARGRDREKERESRLSVQIYDHSRDREREIDVEKVTDRRIAPRAPPQQKRSEMWTEITKDLVLREAIDQMGYEYEETDFFYYIMQYLRYEDVLQIVQVSDGIRRARKDRVRELQWERERDVVIDDWHHHSHHHHSGSRHRHSHSTDRHQDERVVEREREVVYDSGPRVRGYLR